MLDFLSEFPVTQELIHLNHAAVSPWPQRTVDAIKAFAEENQRYGSWRYPDWLDIEAGVREKARQLINAPAASSIALVKNTSEGLSFIASGLDWMPGDNIVGIQQEFPSNRFVWQSLSDQGVEFRELNLEQNIEYPEAALMDLCDERTRLLAVSAVQYCDGFRLDLVRLGQFCRDNGILFSVDAIQQIGAIQFDLQEYHADFVIADGHKWMMAPEGLGIFYVNADILDQVKPSQFGWHMAADSADFSARTFIPAHDSRRFESGSPNMLGIHALNASLEYIAELGMNTISSNIDIHINKLHDGLSSISNIEILSDMHKLRRSGILTFRSHKVSNEILFQHLHDNRVFCAVRGGGIRLSPHFYTPVEHLDKTLELIQSLH